MENMTKYYPDWYEDLDEVELSWDQLRYMETYMFNGAFRGLYDEPWQGNKRLSEYNTEQLLKSI